jgi:hypothetical protein
MLTFSRRVFSFASGSQNLPSKGQLGFSWENWPTGAYDMPHEITTLIGFPVKQIATGDYHSLVCDFEGRAFTFGHKTAGQIGFPCTLKLHTLMHHHSSLPRSYTPAVANKPRSLMFRSGEVPLSFS